MNEFGDLLRRARRGCFDPERRRPLTQERLGFLLGEALGDWGYSGAAVSEWERGKSKIHADQREVLVGLLQVLQQLGGIQDSAQADELLAAGNYRALNAAERGRLFPAAVAEWPLTAEAAPPEVLRPEPPSEPVAAEPHWTVRLLAWLRTFLAGWPAERVLRALPWVGVWVLTWQGALALCGWPFAGPEQIRAAVVTYALSALIAPWLIAWLTGFPPEAAGTLAQERWARGYSLLGAMVGYHAAYLIVFGVALGLHYVEVSPLPAWVAALLAVGPVAFGFTGARQVPADQLRAFGRLRPGLAEAAILAGFGLFSVWWGAFFFAFNRWLLEPAWGSFLILAAVGLGAVAALRRRS